MLKMYASLMISNCPPKYFQLTCSISKQSNDKKSIFGQLIWDSGHCVEWAGFTRVSTIAGVQ